MGRRTETSILDGTRSAGKRRRKDINIKKKSVKSRVKITLLILLIILCLLQVLKLQIQNELSIKDFEYSYLLTELKKQIEENSLLQQEILQNEALITIQQEARIRGFLPAQIVIIE